jgi:radical SAM protein with 4Fe4S-binding SPASM domain
MNDSYSYLKAFRHPDILQSIRDGKPGRPMHVDLILSDLCQQSCKFCSYRMEGYQANQMFDDKRMMTEEKAYEILEDCRELGVKGIVFQGGGEPTIHYRFPEIFAKACSYGQDGIRAALISNGVRIGLDLAMIVVRAAWVRISLDAATEETYCAIRRVHPSHWAKARQAARNLREQRDKQKTDCVIGVGFVVTPDNWREVADAARMAKELGADNFRISAQFSNQDEKLFEGFHAEAAALCREAAALTCTGFTVYNRFADRLEDLTLKQPEDALCGYQFFTTYIGADLNVYRCCGYAYNERGLMGSLKEQRFIDFWRAQERFDEQRKFDGRGCERCQFRKINQTLAYALDPKPQVHEEFV